MPETDGKRSDGGSWDLTSSVGATATAVAARRALASKGPHPLIDDPFAEPLVRTRFFDAFFLDAANAGIRQAVILASGLDTRAYRLAWPGPSCTKSTSPG